MTVIADVFPEIPVAKNMVRKMTKTACFRALIDKEHGKLVETMFQYESQDLYKIDQSL